MVLNGPTENVASGLYVFELELLQKSLEKIWTPNTYMRDMLGFDPKSSCSEARTFGSSLVPKYHHILLRGILQLHE